MTLTVRRAEISDVPWMVSQAPAFSAQYATKKPLFGDDAFYATEGLKKAVTDHVVFIAADGDQQVGMISGLVVPHLYNPTIRVLAEMFWWVVPAYRCGRAGLMLINAFVAWGKANCDWVTFGLMPTTQVKEKALTKRGFRLQEHTYVLEVA